jgi:putative transcriptional regulator
MDKKVFAELMGSVEEHIDIAKGESKASRVFSVSNVSAIREKLHLTQEKFAKMMGVSVWTLRNWEQGRREPKGAARSLLMIADRKPKALLEALLD